MPKRSDIPLDERQRIYRKNKLLTDPYYKYFVWKGIKDYSKKAYVLRMIENKKMDDFKQVNNKIVLWI